MIWIPDTTRPKNSFTSEAGRVTKIEGAWYAFWPDGDVVGINQGGYPPGHPFTKRKTATAWLEIAYKSEKDNREGDE